jgi:hypothetical protein
MRTRFSWLAAAALLLAVGCQGELSQVTDDGTGPAPPGGSANSEPSQPPPPGPDDCRPPRRAYWQLTPKQLATTYAQLAPELTPQQIQQLEIKLLLYAVHAEPYSSTPSLSNATPAFVNEAVDAIAVTVRSILSQESLESVHPCLDSGRDSACIDETVERFGRTAWRRPVSPDEHAAMTEFYDSMVTEYGEDVALELLLRRILGHPAALFRSTVGEVPEGEDFARLNPHEIADFVAYTITERAPDAELSAAADSGELTDPAVLESHVRRLMAEPPATETVVADGTNDPKKVVGILRFFREWLDVDDIQYANIDEVRDLNDRNGLNVERALRWLDNESMMFLRHVLWNSLGTLEEILSADYIYTGGSRSLWRYYIESPSFDGDSPETTEAPDGRMGILMQGGWLVSHKSATHRGLFIRAKMFCEEVEAPVNDQIDMNLPGLEEQLEAEEGRDLSPREVRERHMTDPSCSGCHRTIDPMGFPFDHFGTDGLYRQDWDGFTIDTTGEIVGTEMTDGQVDGAQALVSTLADSPEVRACFVEQLYTYVHGRHVQQSDTCYLDRLKADFEANGDVRELFVQMLIGEESLTRTPRWLE